MPTARRPSRCRSSDWESSAFQRRAWPINMYRKRSRLCEKSKSWIADPATPKGKHDDGPVATQITRGCQPFRWREVLL